MTGPASLNESEISEIETRVISRLKEAFLDSAGKIRISISLREIGSESRYPNTVVVARFISPDIGPQVFGFRYPIWAETAYLQEIGPERFADYAWLELEEIIQTHELNDYARAPNPDVTIWLDSLA